MKKNLLKLAGTISIFALLELSIIPMINTSIYAFSTTSDISRPDTTFSVTDVNLLTGEVTNTILHNDTISNNTNGTVDKSSTTTYNAGNSGTIDLKAVIGMHDERQLVSNTSQYPYCAIAYTETTWPKGELTIGTAFIFDSNKALTAAHYLYDPSKGGNAKSITIYPGQKGSYTWNNPYGCAEAINMRYIDTYKEVVDANYSVDKNNPYNLEATKYDWGVLKLDDDIGNKTGYIPLRAYPSLAALAGKTAYISGYPKSHQFYQYLSSGPIWSCNRLYVTHKIDATEGAKWFTYV